MAATVHQGSSVHKVSVNSDVTTTRHSEPIKSRFSKFRQLTAWPPPPPAYSGSRPKRAARACEWDGASGARATPPVGGRRMMYRVVELGSNCVGKWPRLEPARAAPRRVRKPT